MSGLSAMRGVKIAGWIFGLLLAIILASLAFLLYTQTGARWSVSLLQGLTPMEISLGSLQGRLAGPLSLRQLKVQQGDMSLGIEAINLDWRPSALFKGELHLLNLDVQGIELVLPASEAKPAETPTPFKGVMLPLALRIDALSVARVNLSSSPEAKPLLLEHLSLSAHSAGSRLEITQLEIAALSATLKVHGGLNLTQDLPMELTADWTYTLPEAQVLAGRGEVKGDLKQLDVTQTLDAPLAGQLQASLFELQQKLHWEAAINLRGSELEALVKSTTPLQFSGRLASRGSPENIGLEADLKLRQPDYGDAQVTLQGAFAQQVLDIKSLEIKTPQGTSVRGEGRYTVDEAWGEFDAKLDWQALRWPLQGEAAQFVSRQGELKIDGRPDDYRYRLEMDAELPDQPPGRLQASGKGNLQGLNLASLLANLSQGSLEGKGEIAWQPAVRWQLDLKGKQLNPALWRKDFPGQLELVLQTQGVVDKTGVNGHLNLSRLQGVLRGYSLQASGKASLAGERLSIESLQILSGENRIEVNGQIEERLALHWGMDAPNLEAFWPGLAGAVEAEGDLTGNRKKPRLAISLKGQKLAYGQQRVAGLQLNADIGLAEDQALDLKLQAEDLHTPAGRWTKLDLALTGSLLDHRVVVDLQGEGVSQAALTIEAGWVDQVWRGRVQQLTLALPDQDEWQLASPTAFSLAADSQQVDRLCLTSQSASLCGRFEGGASQGWQAQAALKEFPLALLQPFIDTDLHLAGKAELEANMLVDAGGRSQGELNLRLPEGRLGLDLTSDEESIDFAGAWLKASIGEQGGKAQLEMPLTKLGRVEAQLDLPHLDLRSLDRAGQPMTGILSAKIDDLTRLSLLSPQLQNIKGRISSDFTIAGTLAKPTLEGSADLLAGAMDIPALGLELREISLRMRAPELDHLTLEGALRSGKGSLQMNGDLELNAEAGFPARLQLKGESLTVANLPEAEVEITPDLTLQNGHGHSTLKGEIQIPFARIRPRKLPSNAVSSSSDLVVVGGDEEQQHRVEPKLSTELRVSFGKRVSFDGFGLRGNLTGSLLVIDEPQRPVIGRGRVGIVDGTYRAYGQDLKIERGFALFADSPVDNPGLDVRAVREIEDITAGVRVGGTLKSPKVDLFSTPSMSEGDVLSYLVTGHPPGEGSGQSVGVAAALRASGAGEVGDELGRQLGLDELRLDTGNGLEGASVVAGTYLSPRLYLQYINALASRETKVRMRYDINKHLQLEAETGKSQAGDLYYTIER
jgi:translocation and assembly module TamB